MDPHDLVSRWHVPPSYPLTPKQISIRLPIDVAAKVEGLCDIYPGKTKSEIVADLVAVSIEQVIRALPSEKGEWLKEYSVPGEIGVYQDIGAKGKFLEAAEGHLRRLELEVGQEEKIPLPLPQVRMKE